MRFKNIIGLVAIVALTSCRTPQQKQESAQQKVLDKALAIAKNEATQKDHGRDYAYAGLFALRQDPAPSEYSRLSIDCLSKSMNLMGEPDFGETKRLQEMVNGLLSTNAELRASATAQFEVKDAQIVSLQTKETGLRTQLGTLQKKLEAVNAENASLASTWVRLKHIGWWFFWIFVGGFIIRLVLTALPPPYNGIGYVFDYIIGFIQRGVFKMMPKAKETAGVIGQEAHDLVAGTLTSVTTAIEALKKSHPDSWANLGPLLATVLPDEHKATVDEHKL